MKKLFYVILPLLILLSTVVLALVEGITVSHTLAAQILVIGCLLALAVSLVFFASSRLTEIGKEAAQKPEETESEEKNEEEGLK